VKLLLDECIDRRLAKEIEGHEVVTVPQAGWAGIQNGELLRLAQAQFDVFVTVDRNLSFQQHLPQFTIAVIVLQAPTNRLKDLRPLVTQLQRKLSDAPKGQVTWVSL
jgi:Domain of unknown function (DUF5615)